jgi:glycosyltransferase involved in cell wall biosynthesis
VKTAVRLSGESICFVGCSASVYRERAQQGELGGEWHRVFNGVDVDKYTFVPAVSDDAPLAFLGRLEPIKGVHHAIAIARLCGRRLLIGGNRVEAQAAYFEREIAPHLDGDRVRWLGPLDDPGKDALLGQAAALLMPVECEEAFGIVMAEALACGTPVIGFPRGGVPEVILEGKTGFVCSSVEAAARAVARLGALDRRAARVDCETRFSERAVVDGYEQLYRRQIARLNGIR